MQDSSEIEYPRITNRGVQNTVVSQNTNNKSVQTNDYSVKGELKCLIDWFEFTIPLVVKFDDVFLMLGIPKSEFIHLSDRNILGYSEVYMNGHILVLTGGTVDMGHHVQMSGQGCRELEQYAGSRWKDLIGSILNVYGKFSRLDIAIDDFKGYFKIEELIQKIKDGELTSLFKRAKRIEDILISTGESKGNTLYYGRASSDIQIRMYEKNFEQEMELEIDVWNRTEIQLRNKRALEFAMKYSNGVQDVGEYARGVVKNYLTFRDKDPNDINKSRWDVSQFWLDFLDGVDKLQLTTKKPDRSMQRIKKWLYNQTSKSLAMFAVVEPEEIKSMIAEGYTKFNDRDEMLIDKYIKEKELLEIEIERLREIKKNLLLNRRSKRENK